MYLQRFFLQYLPLFLILLCLPASLPADIFDHLQPVKDKKEGAHGVHGIDFLYIINLNERPEKFERSVKQLEKYAIRPHRFAAINGWKLPIEILDAAGLPYDPKTMEHNFSATTYDPSFGGKPHHEIMSVPGRRYFTHNLSRGAIGINFSHLSILKDALDSGYTTVWIMEDDIQVFKNPHIMSDMIKKLDKRIGKKNWDILFTDKDMKGPDGSYMSSYGTWPMPNWKPSNMERFKERIQVGRHFTKVGARFGAHSYIIRRSGMKKILNFYKKYGAFLPFDVQYYLPEDISLYCVKEDIISNMFISPSDNYSPSYTKQSQEHQTS